MNIRIVNLRTYTHIEGEILIKVDRSTVVGNPFYMRTQTKSERDIVCDKYDVYFKEKMRNDPLFMAFVNHIVELGRTKDIALGCWCFPKRCHAETILEYILKRR
jgi:hypothetical protein